MDFKQNIRRVSRNLIVGTSRATRGAYYDNMYLNEEKGRAGIVMAISKASWFERLWYPIFFLAGIFCLIFIRPFNFELCFAVLSLWLYMFANNLLAKGKLLGLVLSIISASLYVVVSFFAKVYGEVIINVLLYIPLDVIALCTFKKNRDKTTNEIEVKSLEPTTWFITFGLTILGGALIYLLLYFLPGQQYPFLNMLSIVMFLAALFLRNARFKEFWWFNFVGNVVSIVMWVLVSTTKAELLYSLPMALSSLAALLNNIYGIIMWQKIYKAEMVNGGIYVKRNVKINSVVKLRRQYTEALKWNAEVEEKRKIRLEKLKKRFTKAKNTKKNEER